VPYLEGTAEQLKPERIDELLGFSIALVAVDGGSPIVLVEPSIGSVIKVFNPTKSRLIAIISSLEFLMLLEKISLL